MAFLSARRGRGRSSGPFAANGAAGEVSALRHDCKTSREDKELMGLKAEACGILERNVMTID